MNTNEQLAMRIGLAILHDPELLDRMQRLWRKNSLGREIYAWQHPAEKIDGIEEV